MGQQTGLPALRSRRLCWIGERLAFPVPLLQERWRLVFMSDFWCHCKTSLLVIYCHAITVFLSCEHIDILSN